MESNSGEKKSASSTSDSESAESNSMIKTKVKGGSNSLLVVPGNNKKVKNKNQNYLQHHHQHQEDLKKRPNEIEFTSQDSFLKKFSLLNHSQLNVGSVKNNEPSPMTERRLRKLSKSLYSPSTMKKMEHSYDGGGHDSNESSSAGNQHNAVSSSNPSSSKTAGRVSLPQVIKDSSAGHTSEQNNKQQLKKLAAEANSSTLSSSSSSTSSVKFRPRWSARACLDKCLFKLNYFVLSPDENVMYAWLVVLSACVLYNIWLIIARQSFEKLQTEYRDLWFVLDLVTEAVYALDILIQFRTGYLEQGLLVYDSKKLALNYVRSRHFMLDLFSLMPLEIAQFWLDYELPMLRFPRFFKVYRTIQFYYMTENRTLYPNVWRVANLTHILFCLGHWFAGFYFLISKAEGFKGHWSYPKPVDEFALLSRMYLRCLYWSTLTLTTIGDLPPPETNWQWLKEMSEARYLFSIAVHYLAVFVIALIVGQVGNVITNRNASRAEFERLLDGAKRYMRNHNVPAEMQKRVQRWYDYSWSRGRMNGAGDIHSIGLLPDKLKTELALHVNLETLRKVTIFQECQPEFLHDLVLKMRAYIFTPGDMICRKGEIAREMFIIADGVLEVIGDNGNVLTKMYSGDFFGEIGILNIEGASNRRTADVRSVGYAELFSLSKEDVLCAVKDYPEAERILIEYGKRRLLHNNNSRASVATSKASVLAVGDGVIVSAIDIHNKISSETENKENVVTPPPIDKIVITSPEESIATTVTSNSRSRNTSLRAKPTQYVQEINRKTNELLHSGKMPDIELGLKNVIVNTDETNRGLITDMLGLPASLAKPKQPEILISSAYTMTELNKIAQREENLESELNKTRAAEAYLNKGITDTLDEIIKASGKSDSQVENLIKKLKDQLQQSKDKRIEFLEDLIAQKEAKIKLFDSRLRILQKYVSQKRSDSYT